MRPVHETAKLVAKYVFRADENGSDLASAIAEVVKGFAIPDEIEYFTEAELEQVIFQMLIQRRI